MNPGDIPSLITRKISQFIQAKDLMRITVSQGNLKLLYSTTAPSGDRNLRLDY